MANAAKEPKSLLSESAVFIAASILAAGMPFLLLPVLTAYIAPAQFGMLGVFQGLYTVFLPLCGLGVGSAIVRQSYDSKPQEIAVYIFNAILVMLVSTLVLALLLVLFRKPISEALGAGGDIMYLALASAAAMFVFNIYLGQCQVNQMARRFGVLQVSQSGLNVVLSLLLTIVFAMGVHGRIWGVALAAIVFCIVGVIGLVMMSRLSASFNYGDIRNALRFGLPLIPHELGTFFTNWFAVILMNRLLPAEQVGVYTLAFYAAMALGLLCDAFNRAFVPWLFARLKRNDDTELMAIVNLTWKYFAFMAALTVIAFWVGPFAVSVLFGEAYATAGGYIGWLVAGQALGGCYLMVTNYIIYHRRTEVVSGITIGSSVINVALLVLILPIYGLAGAVFAFVFTRGLILVLTFYFANLLQPMPWFALFKPR